jgi:hypothetical protein
MERHMFRRLAFTAVLSLAVAVPARAQSVAQAPASNEPAPCASLHAMMLQHAQAMGLDSAQIDSIHALVHAAIANGAAPDSVHHALIAVLMQSTGGHAAMQNHMQAMQMDSTQIAAIHACLSSHGTAPRGTER